MALNNFTEGPGRKQVPLLLGLDQLDPRTNLEIDKGNRKTVPLVYDGGNQTAVQRIEGSVSDPVQRLLKDEYHPEFSQHTIQQKLAENQSSGGQFLAFLNQGIVGNVIGQTIEGIGYLTDLRGPAMLTDDGEKSFGELLVETGKKLRTWSEETTPIFADPDQESFAPGKWSWWMKNGTSVFSTLSLMIPGSAVVKGLGAAGKMIGLAGKIGVGTKTALSVLGQATISRHMENMMEASGAYEETYKQAIEIDKMSEQDARKKASIAASKTYSGDWAMLGMDIAQYALLHGKLFKPTSTGATPALGKLLGYDKGKIALAEAKRYVTEAAGEGFEEGYQWMSTEEGKYAAERAFDPTINEPFNERVQKYLSSGEMWTNTFFGALGGAAFKAGGEQVQKWVEKGDPQVNEVKSWGVSFKAAYDKMKAAQSIGDEYMAKEAQDELTSMIGVRAASKGMLDQSIDMFDRIASGKLTQEEVEKLGYDPTSIEDLKGTDVEQKKKDIRAAGDRYMTNLKRVFDTASPLNKSLKKLYNARPKDMANVSIDNYARSYASLLTRGEIQLEKLNESKLKVQEEVNEAERKIVNFEKLSYPSQQMFILNAMIKSAEKQKSLIEKAIEGKEINEKHKKDIDAQTAAIDFQIKNLQKIYDVNKKDFEELTPDEQKADKNVNIDSPAIEEYYNKMSIRDRLDSSITGWQSAIDRYKKGDISSDEARTNYDNKLDEEDQDDKDITPEENDIVSWVDGEGVTRYGIVNAVDATDNTKYTVQEVNDKFKDVGKPINKNKVDLNLVEKIGDLEIDKMYVESISTDELSEDDKFRNELEDSGLNKALADLANSASNANLDLSKQSRIDVRDKALDAYSSLPQNMFDGAVATYSIDWTNVFFDRDDETIRKFKLKARAGKLTEKDIEKLLSVGDLYQEVFNSELVDKLPIKVTIKVGDQSFDNGIFMHDSDFWNVRMPVGLEYEGTPESYVLEQRQNCRAIRREILTNLLRGNTVNTTGLRKLNGWLNLAPIKGNIHKRLNVESGSLKLYIGVPDATGGAILQSSSVDISAEYKPRIGGVYIKTKKTCNGAEILIRVNISKLSVEHAEILYEAIINSYTKGFKSKVTDSRVSDKLTAREVTNLLALFGDRATNPAHENNKYKELDENKALFVKSGQVLFFGKNQLNIHEKDAIIRQQDRARFIEWAITHKNYRIPIANKSMGLELNSIYKKKFKIGALENDGTKPFATLLMDTVIGNDKGNPMYILSTNVDRVINPIDGQYIESVTHNPLIDINARSIEVSNPRVIVNETPPKPAKPGVTKPTSITKDTLPTTDALKLIDVDTNLYYTKSDGGKVVFGTIKLGKNGVKYLSLGNGFDTLDITKGKENLRVVKTNQDAFNDLFKFILNSSDKIEFEKTVPPDNQKDTGDESIDDIVVGGKPYYTPKAGTEKLSEKQLDWLYKRFGKLNVQKTDQLIQIAGRLGKLYFGVFRADAIKIYKAAPGEVLFHEAFHRVSLGYLSEADRQRVYAEAKRRYSLQGFNTDQIEEFLADKFMEYKSSGATPQTRGFMEFISDIYDFIVTFFTGQSRLRSYDINKLFDSIERGKFRYSKISNENQRELLGREVGYEIGNKDIPGIDSIEEMNSLITGLTTVLIQQNHISNLNDVSKLDFSKLLNYIKKDLLPRFNSVKTKNENKLTNGELTDEQRDKISKELEDLKHSIHLYETVIDNEYLPIFVERINSALSIYNIKFRSDDQESSNEVSDEPSDFIAKLNKGAYEFNTKDNVMASIKFLIATLPKSPKVNRLTRVIDHVDFNETWSQLLFDLWDKDTIEAMLAKLDEKSSIYSYKVLADKLRSGDDLLRNQFKVSMNKHKHLFINFLFSIDYETGKPVFEMSRADNLSAAKIEVMSWNQMLYDSNLIDKTDKPKINEPALDKVLEDYRSMSREFSKKFNDSGKSLTNDEVSSFVDEMVIMLSKIYIYVDKATILEYVSQKARQLKITQSEALNLFVLQDAAYVFKRLKDEVKNKSINIQRLFSDESTVKKLSQMYFEVNPDLLNDSVIGPGGNQYFTYSQNNYLSDMMRKFSKDKNVIVNKLSKIYNKNSDFLKQLLDPDVRSAFKLLTFSAAIQKEVGDSGREYLSINQIEDYLIKMYAFERGLIALPTLADKKSYFFLEGLKAIDFNLIFNEDGSITIPEDVIDVFLGYAKDEKERIERAKETIDSYNNEQDPTIKAEKELKLINNYHYIKRGNNPIDTKKANALLYHVFPSFNAEGFDFDRDAKLKINEILLRKINDELLFASKLNVINGRLQESGKFIPDSSNRLDEGTLNKNVEDLGSQEKAITNMIARFAFRTIQADIETDKLFTGDPAFKQMSGDKGTVFDDKVKRLTGLISTGDTTNNKSEEYGVTSGTYNVSTMYTQKVNLEKLYTENVYDNIFDAVLNSYVEDFSKTEGNEDLMSKRKDEKLKILKDKFGINVKELLKGFKEIDSTDGQAWISPDMYRSLSVSIGDWSPEKEVAFNLLQSDRKLTEEEYVKSMAIVMQPLKIVSYGLYEEGDLEIPLYDKMSLATIFRQMGKFSSAENHNIELMDLLDRMEAKGKYKGLKPIQMVKMNTVAKTGGRTGFNFYSDENRTNVADFTNIPVFEQPFALSRRQLVTDPHDKPRTKTGTQMIKMGLADIMKDLEIYDNPALNIIEGKSKITGRELIDVVLKCTNAISDKGADRLKEKLGFKDGKVDKKKLVETLKRDSSKAGVADLIIDALKMDGDEMYLELDAFPNRKQIFTRVISMIAKDTIDMKLPGNQFIQMSNNGLRINYNTELKWSTVKDGKVNEMECIVSINLFKHVIPNYENLTFEEKRKFIKDNADSIMGYRIPTQGQNSVFILKIKDVFPETIGDVISLPAPFTKLTGSDFDIDKVYLVRHNYSIVNGKLHKIGFHNSVEKVWEFEFEKKYAGIYRAFNRLDELLNDTEKNEQKKKESVDIVQALLSTSTDEVVEDDYKEGSLFKLLTSIYNDSFDYKEYEKLREKIGKIEMAKDAFFKKYEGETNPFVFNSREAIENLLIDSYKSIYSNLAHVKQTQVPLGSMVDKIKVLARDVNEIDGNKMNGDLDAFSPERQSQIKFEYTGGKDGIGPFALANVHHILTQIADVKMRASSAGLLIEDDKGQIDLSQINGKDGYSIESWLSALIDVHVDIAKDPFVMWLNINSSTYDVVSLLIRGGYGEDTFRFISQPIIKEYSNLLLNSGEEGRISMFRDKAEVKKEVIRRWQEKMDKANPDKVEIAPYSEKQLMSRDELWSNIKDQNNKNLIAEYYAKQLQYLDIFLNLTKTGKVLNELVQASQLDTKKFGNSITQLISYKKKIDKLYRDDNFVNLDRLFSIQNPSTISFLGPYYRNFLDFTLHILKDLTIYSTPVFNELLNEILRLSKNDYAGDKKLIDNIADELMGAISAEFFNDEDWIGINPSKLGAIVRGITKIISEIKYTNNEAYKDLAERNSLIKILNNAPFDIEENLPFDKYLVIPNKNLSDKFSSDSLMYAWRDLFNHPDDKIRKLGRLLLYYSFATSAFRSRLYSFHNYIPPTVMKEFEAVDPRNDDNKIPVSYNEFIKAKRELLSDPDNILIFSHLIDEVFINNWSNSSIVPRTRHDKKLRVFNINGKETDTPTAFVVRKWNNRIGKNKLGQPVYTKYLTTSVGTKAGYTVYLIKYIGFIEEKNKKGEEIQTPVYKVVSKRSHDRDGVVLREYLFDKSIIPSNNVVSISDGDEVKTLMSQSNLKDYPIFRTFTPVESDETVAKKEDNLRNILTGDAVLDDEVYEEETIPKTEVQSLDNLVMPNITFKTSKYGGYPGRTKENAGADATIAMAINFNSAGEKLTKQSAVDQHKKYIPIDASSLEITDERVNKLIIMLKDTNSYSLDSEGRKGISLNIAGNSMHSLKGTYTQEQVDNFVYELLKAVVENPLFNKYAYIRGIVTGGQSGFDEAGAKAGAKLGIPTIVNAPAHWLFRDATGADISDEVRFKARFATEVKQPEQLELFNKPDISSLDPSRIYDKLGNKTVSGNVRLESWKNNLENMTEPYTYYNGSRVHIIATRPKGAKYHFGNPFSHDAKVVARNSSLIKTDTIKEAVIKYIDWVINSDDDRARWIRDEIEFGGLKNKSILYWSELGEPSHATALDYLINKYDWSTQEEYPFLPDDKNTIFSTSNKEVYDLVVKLGITEWTDVTPDQWKELRDKYAHCK